MGVIGPLGDLGPCQFSWGGTVVSSVLESRFRFVETSAGVKEAEHGTTNVDEVLTGCEACEIDSQITRSTYAVLALVIPGGSNSGGESGNIQVTALTTGRSMYENAQELIVKRIVDGVVDTNQQYWLHFPKAYPQCRFDVPYDTENQRGFLCVWKSFPDQSNGSLHWHIGDIV